MTTEEALRRTLFLAEGMFQMIDPQTWRDHGGDDGQGHYEGDYRADNVRDELAELRAVLTEVTDDEGDGREPDGYRISGGRVIPIDR